jgi:protein TonB
METKKTPSKDLELKKNFFFQLGIVIALALVLTAFEWKTFSKQFVNDIPKIDILFPEEIEITRPEKEPEPPAPVVPEMNIVDDKVEVDEFIFIDIESNENTSVGGYYVPKIPDEEIEIIDDTPFIISEVMPSFPGGEAEMFKFLTDNLKIPQRVKEIGISGTVYIEFVVERDGSLSNFIVKRGVFDELDREAIRVLRSMPLWEPGVQSGRPVRVQLSLPIKFTLQN